MGPAASTAARRLVAPPRRSQQTSVTAAPDRFDRGLDPRRSPFVPSYPDLRLLAVHAHPDDESSKGAGTMSHYRGLGVDVMVATNTGGERGDILNAAMEGVPHAERDLPGYRRDEMRRAAEALDIKHRWMGFMDSGLPEGDPLPPLPAGCFALQPVEIAAAPLVKLIREFRPHVILTYDENGGYPHPDHIQTHNVSMHAWQTAGDPTEYPDLGEPWQPLKLYYDKAFNTERFIALHEAMTERGLESPFAERIARIMETQDAEGNKAVLGAHPTTTKIFCPESFSVREEALRCHETQVAPDSLFFAVSPEFQAAAWPWEDYVLAESRVDSPVPETCLFAGIVDEVRPDPDYAPQPDWQI
ncbi:mycothiol conjugate amidase Mca [Kocuria sp. JC486]|nr:mycothiol conjugate amidase Mca [Kocuria sp. JC486]